MTDVPALALSCPRCGGNIPNDGRFCPHDGGTGVALDSADPNAGRLLDRRYRLLETIGKGGLGTVHRAVHMALLRPVAVKLLHPDFAARGWARGRFLREARAASRLTHPGCVKVMDFGDDDDALFLVMELLAGHDLSQEAARGPLPTVRALLLAAQMLEALQHAHDAGVVHRDLKPSNLFVVHAADGEMERLSILDFGLAKILSPDAGEEAVTARGQVMGTPSYLAPEQVTGDVITPAADLYSAGVVLFELITGTLPYDAPVAEQRAAQHLVDPIPSAGERRPGLSADLDRFLRRALGKRPQERFPSADAMRRALLHTPEARPLRRLGQLRRGLPGLDMPRACAA